MRRPWRLVGILGAALLLLAGAFAVWVQAAAERRWEEARSRLAELQALPVPPMPPRLPSAEAIPGSPDDDYVAAWQVVRNRGGEIGRLLEQNDPPLPPEYAAALEAVDRGVRRRDPPRDLSPFKKMNVCTKGTWGDFESLARLACFQAEREGPSPGLAVRPLLANAGMMIDLLRDYRADYLVFSALETSLPVLQHLLEAGGWSRDDLQRVDRDLELLDARMPGWSLHDRSSAEGDLERLLEEPPHAGEVGWLERWRYGGSTRLMLADAALRVEEWTRRSLATQGGPFHDIVAVEQAMRMSMDASRNPILRGHLVPTKFRAEPERKIKARLRLCRLAARYQIEGTMADIEDPFGKRFLVESRDGCLYARSACPNEDRPPLEIRLRAP